MGPLGGPALVGADELGPDDPSAVSCTSDRFCAAIDDSGRVANWDGGRWSKPIEVDPPPGHHGGPPIFGPFIYSVACWTARSCAVVDAWGHALTWDGSRWSQREELGVSFDAISCAGEEDCMALSTGGTAFIWDGVRWSEQAALPVRTATHSTVSCVTSAFCEAVVGNEATTWDGTSWTPPKNLGPALDPVAVSCPAAGLCIAATISGEVAIGRAA